MEAATTTRSPIDGLRRFLGTRRGSFLVAAVAAGLAAIVLIVYLNNYKNDVKGSTTPTQVLIADRVISAGTSGDIVASERFFRPTTVARDDVKAAAVADASALVGKTAARDIFPGEQITASDFRVGSDTLRGRLTGTQRAIALPVDAAHGLVGSIRAGDHIDVFSSFTGGAAANRGVLKTLAQNVLVLQAPGTGAEAPANGANTAVVVRASADQAARMAFSADSGKLWFVLRPPSGSENAGPTTVTQQSVATP
jgi:Flp pilus assembly protein CpaB